MANKKTFTYINEVPIDFKVKYVYKEDDPLWSKIEKIIENNSDDAYELATAIDFDAAGSQLLESKVNNSYDGYTEFNFWILNKIIKNE